MIVQNLEGLYPTNCMHFKMKICLPSANTRKMATTSKDTGNEVNVIRSIIQLHHQNSSTLDSQGKTRDRLTRQNCRSLTTA